jgi:hypothetical protein
MLHSPIFVPVMPTSFNVAEDEHARVGYWG